MDVNENLMKNHAKNDFESQLHQHIFAKLKEVAKDYGGMYKLLNYFMCIPDEDAGFNYAIAGAERARQDINEGISTGDIEIEILSVKFDAAMDLEWTFRAYACIAGSDGSKCSIHRISATKNKVTDHDCEEVEDIFCVDEKIIEKNDWDLITGNFINSTQ